MWSAKSSPKYEPAPNTVAGDFLTHLEELRGRLIFSLAVFFIATLLSFFFSRTLLDFFIRPLTRFENITLYFQSPQEAFLTHLAASALAGFVLSTPFLLTQLWFFITPGLYASEKKIILSLALVSFFLFLIGALFAYLVVVPWGLRFLLSFQTENLKPLLGAGPYFSFLIGMIVAFGVLFDFPVVIFGLVRLGIVEPRTLSRSRRAVAVAAFVISAILTPSTDPISQTLLAIPLIVLFEMSVAISRLGERMRVPSVDTQRI